MPQIDFCTEMLNDKVSNIFGHSCILHVFGSNCRLFDYGWYL